MIKTIKRTLLLVVMLPIFCHAQSAERALAEKLQAFNKLSANFIQETSDSRGKIIQTAKGNMALERPGKLRWYTSEPMEQLIVTNGQVLWVYDVDLEQATRHHLQQAMGQAPALLLSGNIDAIREDFAIKQLTSQQPDQSRFELTPYDEDSFFKKLDVTFLKNILSEITFTDPVEQVTDLLFTHVKVNPVLKPSLFEFKPPAGVDVIDNTNG